MAREATHRTCESHRRLDVRSLARSGLLSGSGTLTWADGHHVTISGYGESMELSYEFNGGTITERVSLSKTRVHLGGHRSWFLCPGCNHRIATLYFVKQFRCRHCHDLRYASQRETPRFRAISKVQRVRKKLGGSANLTEQTPSRPRYMHHRTYQRLLREEADAWQAYSVTR